MGHWLVFEINMCIDSYPYLKKLITFYDMLMYFSFKKAII